VPVFAVPDAISGASPATTWSPLDQLALGPKVHAGQVITEHFEQAEPTISQLRSASNGSGDVPPDLSAIPSGVPQYVFQLVARLTRGATSPYERAAALQRYFTDPANGFLYDLHSSVGDSGSALVDFLKGKHGFCQQYAAALAVMLRVAGVPSRVVLGYMHPAPDAHGNFTVTSYDAHSWVEAYFAGIGWIPFDPTPSAGLADPAQTDLPWARHPAQGQVGNSGINNPHATGSGHPTSAAPSSSGAGVGPHHHRAGASGAGQVVPTGTLITLVVIGALLLILLIPALVRWRRRRRRLAAGRRNGDAEALWAELSDTAVDLGYVWSPARSPRQVVQWLSRDARDSRESLQALATAVEQRRYAPEVDGTGTGAADPRGLGEQLRRVISELRHRRNGRTRIGAVLWPASLTGSRRWLPRPPFRRH
jgi:hypothetical protein